ncbi:MAG: DEAD/DEAH box helicase family protein [Deltaproteobacteria bacterium]|jgi:type I restriction enzyme R subunit|nr:DEAD/DEAH box helicase family protein [Deltaproteobacteria bacterium]
MDHAITITTGNGHPTELPKDGETVTAGNLLRLDASPRVSVRPEGVTDPVVKADTIRHADPAGIGQDSGGERGQETCGTDAVSKAKGTGGESAVPSGPPTPIARSLPAVTPNGIQPESGTVRLATEDAGTGTGPRGTRGRTATGKLPVPGIMTLLVTAAALSCLAVICLWLPCQAQAVRGTQTRLAAKATNPVPSWNGKLDLNLRHQGSAMAFKTIFDGYMFDFDSGTRLFLPIGMVGSPLYRHIGIEFGSSQSDAEAYPESPVKTQPSTGCSERNVPDGIGLYPNEAETRARFIDPVLREKYSDNQIRAEYYYTNGKITIGEYGVTRGRGKRVDYMLLCAPNIPIGIIEAKAYAMPSGMGLQQAKAYAKDLNVNFAFSTNGQQVREFDSLTGTEREFDMIQFPSAEELLYRMSRNKNWTPNQTRINTTPFSDSKGGKTLRYYQANAVNLAVEAVSRGEKRILLVMATGTGKTLTAFEIIHRLKDAGYINKVLYLADRNIIIDQTIQGDFKHFKQKLIKISCNSLDSSYEIYMSLYQQLGGMPGKERFREFKKDFFDLIIIDECHRGSAKDDSVWREILEHFDDAIQIGMTATPKETRSVSSTGYFGEPVYVYSLKNGIEDGFLAPFMVIQVDIDVDLEGWTPYPGETDKDGKEITEKRYARKDFGGSITLRSRTQLIARWVSDYLKSTDRFNKTMVVCPTIEYAEEMRGFLAQENPDLMSENGNYVARITSGDIGAENLLEDFIDPQSKYPVIVTVCRMMTTGVDTRTCKVIVIDTNIQSTSEFKQIIGRGTRLVPEYIVDGEKREKSFFTIIDFRGASKIFEDKEFNGEPLPIKDREITKKLASLGSGGNSYGSSLENGSGSSGFPKEIESGERSTGKGHAVKFCVEGVEVTVDRETVKFYDGAGQLVSESVSGYSKRNFLKLYPTRDGFLSAWNDCRVKNEIIETLQEHGVLLIALRETIEGKIDDFDIFSSIAYGMPMLTREERAKKIREDGILDRYRGKACKVMDALIDKYVENGIADLEDLRILKIEPFPSFGNLKAIVEAFGGRQNFIDEVHRLRTALYSIP